MDIIIDTELNEITSHSNKITILFIIKYIIKKKFNIIIINKKTNEI